MPSGKTELETKGVLIDKAKQLLDLLYSEADAKADEVIWRFRNKVLRRLDQLSNTTYADEINLLTNFISQLHTALVESDDQSVQLKKNNSNVNYYTFNINSHDIAHENAQQNFGETKIILGPTTHYHIYSPNQEESKIEPAAEKRQHSSLKQSKDTAELKTQATKFSSLYERFSCFYAARRVKRTFGESDEGEVFDDLYTRLALIREREMKEDREHCRKDLISLQHMSADRVARDEHLHLFEHILYTERKPIEEDQLFLPIADDAAALRQKGRIDRILIRGQAGVGKTTFCYHLARKLIEQRHWVLLVPLRHLLDVTEKLTDVEVITRVLEIELTQEEIALLAQLLVDKTQTVYWLLDGYDEVANLPKTHPVQQWLTKVFRKERVIVTTRPRAVEHFEAERQIEMIGYLPEDVEKYVTRYFGQQNKKRESFMAFIKRQTQLGAIHRIPIILELMCWVWNDLTIGQGVNNVELSFTDLYVDVLYGLNQRYMIKTTALSPLTWDKTAEEIEQQLAKLYLDPLLELAYQTFVRNQLIFTGREVARYLPQASSDARRTILYEFGLVRCLRDEGTFDRREFSFIHLTAQEFLMAKRWVQLFTSKNSDEKARAVNLLMGRKEKGEWVDSYKYDKRFEVVWGFVAGLLKDQTHHLHRFLDLIAEAPRDQIGARHISLLLQVVGEANCLNEDTHEYEEIVAWLSNDDYRYIGLKDYASILARYPVVVRVLQKEWDKLWAEKEKWRHEDFVIKLLSWVPLDEKSRIYSDLLRVLGTDTEIGLRFQFAAKTLVTILLTEVQQDEVIRVLFNRLQDAGKHKVWIIIYALENIYLRRPFSQGFSSNLFDHLFAYIEKQNGGYLFEAARILGAMELPEEKHLSILDTLLARLHQTQVGSSNDIKRYAIEALGYIPIPENRQVKITRLLLDRINDKSDFESKRRAFNALSQMNPPEALRCEVMAVFLNYLRDSCNSIRRAIESELRRIFILLSDQVQEQAMDILLTHLKSHDREKKIVSFSVLRDMKISKNYQALVLDFLWNGLHDSDEEVKKYATYALAGMDIPEATQPQFIDALLILLDGLNTRAFTIEIIRTLGAIPIPEELKPKVRDVLFNKFSQEDDYGVDFIVRSLGCIGIPRELGKQIIEVSYARGDKAFHQLNSYCLIMDDELPRYLQEVPHTFVFDSVDAKTVHLAGTFNSWLGARNGKIDRGRQSQWEMREHNEGIWALTIRLLRGSHEFNYVIDGGRRWEHDPNYPLSANGNSELKIEPTVHRTNETNVNNASSLTTAHSVDSHAQISSQLKINSNNSSPINVTSLPTKQAVANDIDSITVNTWRKQVKPHFTEFNTKQSVTPSASRSDELDDELVNEEALQMLGNPSHAEEPEVTDSTNASEEEDAPIDILIP